MAIANKYYEALNSSGIEVLMDDRDERPGVKFKDADLLGMPVRVVLGKRGLDNNEVEVVERKTKKVHKVSPDSLLLTIQEVLASC
jgi:prolyl-tRNA synthetase